MQNEVYRELFGEVSPFVQYRGLTRGRNRRVQIVGSDGATEPSIEMGYDMIVDNSQSGQSLIDNHLREIGQIMVSSAGLYAGPSCVGWKERKAQEIFEQLYGAVVGKKYFDVKFNVPVTNVAVLKEYLTLEGLCADEPTIVVGEQYAQVNIAIPKRDYPDKVAILRKVYAASYILCSEPRQLIK